MIFLVNILDTAQYIYRCIYLVFIKCFDDPVDLESDIWIQFIETKFLTISNSCFLIIILKIAKDFIYSRYNVRYRKPDTICIRG